MTRRLSLVWPDRRPFAARDGRPIRILAASDEHDPTLDFAPNRDALGKLDLVIGCGDLGPDQLGLLGDGFTAPLLFVRGNHDRGGPWPAPEELPIPFAGLDRDSLPGATILGLPWPGGEAVPALRDEGAAWRQVLSTLKLRLVAPGDPAGPGARQGIGPGIRRHGRAQRPGHGRERGLVDHLAERGGGGLREQPLQHGRGPVERGALQGGPGARDGFQ